MPAVTERSNHPGGLITQSEDVRRAALLKEHVRLLEELSASQKDLASYTNLIIFGGYATFFGLWQISRHLLAPTESVDILLWMVASASIFVVFEVGRVAVISWWYTLHAIVALGAMPSMPPEEQQRRINEATRKGQSLNIRFYSFVWPLTSICTIAFAVVAISKLAIALYSALSGAPATLGV